MYLSIHISTVKHPKQNKWFDKWQNHSSMLPSTKTLLYDAFAYAFDLQFSFLWLFSKTTHLFACKTNRIVAGVLQLIEKITYTWSASSWCQSALHVQAKNTFLPYGSTRVTCRNTLLNDSDDQYLRFTDLLSLSILLHFFVCSTCDIICKTEETIKMQSLTYFVILLYHLNEFQKF